MTPQEFLEQYASKVDGGYLIPEGLRAAYRECCEAYVKSLGVAVGEIAVLPSTTTYEDLERLKEEMREYFWKPRKPPIVRAGDIPCE